MSDVLPEKTLTSLLRETCTEWYKDRASRLAAAVAYYAIFSIGPLLLIAIYIIGLMFGKEAASDQLRPQLAEFLSDQGAEFVQQLVAKVGVSPSLSFAGIVSFGILLYAATNLFVAIQDALNSIFNVKIRDDRGWSGMVIDRLLSFGMIILSGVFILASIIVSTAIAALSHELHAKHTIYLAILVSLINFILSTALFTGIFATLFKFLPDIKVRWRDTLVGAGTAALMFTVARLGLAFYLGRSSTTGPFGAAGSLVVVMLFVYYSAQILFFGAEFTQVWAKYRGVPVQPSHTAVSVFEAEATLSASAKSSPAKTQRPDAQASEATGRGRDDRAEAEHSSPGSARSALYMDGNQRPSQWGGIGESNASTRSTNSTPT